MALTCSKKSISIIRITSKHEGKFYCLITFIASEQKTNLNHTKNYVKNFFSNLVMPSEDAKILEFNQYQKSDRAPFIVFIQILNV